MQIIEKKLADLIPYDRNPRKNEQAVAQVANSIREFGFKVPIVVDKNNVIVAGHTRYKAAQQLQLDTVPVIIADDLTPKQIKAFRIADNKTSEKSSWAQDLLKDEVTDLLDDFDMTDFGFGEFELTILTEDFEPEPYDEELIDEYSEGSDNLLAKKRVIINYTEDEEGSVCDLLHLDKITKIVYDINDLLKQE